MKSIATATILAGLCLGLTSPAQSRPAKPPAADERATLFRLLKKAGTLDPDRKLVKIAAICTLSVGGRSFRIVDIVENVPGAASARGIRRVAMIEAGRVARVFAYDAGEPLFCFGGKLLFSAETTIANTQPAGNLVVFEDDVENSTVRSIDTNDLPWPRTGDLMRLP